MLFGCLFSSESVDENEDDSNVPEANPEERQEIFIPRSTLSEYKSGTTGALPINYFFCSCSSYSS